MTDRMDIARFEAVVAAYGATPSRWPAEERAAAEALAAADPRAAALLAEADSIDAALFAHAVPEPSHALRAMVIESAPRRRRLARRARLWWTALAFSIAAGGGAFAGSAATAAFAPPEQLNLYDEVGETAQ